MADQINQELLRKYYNEYDPVKRGKILDELIAENPDSSNQRRKEIYDMRYDIKNLKKNGVVGDGYVNLWMTMKYSAENNTGWFGCKGARKEITKLLEKMGIPGFLETDEKMMYDEFYHLSALYITSSRTDRNYTTSLMGMVPMKDDVILSKIAGDIYMVGYVMPSRIKMEGEFAVFGRAARDAYYDILPDNREYLEELLEKM